MIDMLKFVEEAKTKTLVKLDSDIKVNLDVDNPSVALLFNSIYH